MSMNSDNEEKQDSQTTSASSPVSDDAADVDSQRDEERSNDLNARRGRMIAAGLLATVILAVIAMLVSGIFQVTSRWLMVCPRDLPVNDPAPILWQDAVAEKAKAAKLGVPEKLISQAGFRSGTEQGGASRESGN